MAKNTNNGFFSWETRTTISPYTGDVNVLLFERYHDSYGPTDESRYDKTFSLKDIKKFVIANQCEAYAVPVLMGKLYRINKDFEKKLRGNLNGQAMLANNGTTIINPVYNNEVVAYLMHVAVLAVFRDSCREQSPYGDTSHSLFSFRNGIVIKRPSIWPRDNPPPKYSA